MSKTYTCSIEIRNGTTTHFQLYLTMSYNVTLHHNHVRLINCLIILYTVASIKLGEFTFNIIQYHTLNNRLANTAI